MGEAVDEEKSGLIKFDCRTPAAAAAASNLGALARRGDGVGCIIIGWEVGRGEGLDDGAGVGRTDGQRVGLSVGLRVGWV
eukprot:CAMPEP_0202446816 /NCGR_PEP_ID=MMETSP1360-20130828/5393_1 /ASSEMBLY_ACC=CAM_ASM_000848 /TAXON_ID=515479 /ORGANISM="Licmophora paradoxa, Strain CCMP2313" /LENGTH=79 /DNA_ID=CAMNT_0049063523 /DNA_START=86 /DNA_END=322 /DNA_ORIENTATION=+